MKVEPTPLMRQHAQIKARYPGAIVLFRVGDFYETFGEDAVEASRILGITLTKRSNGAAADVELAGFPHHALDNYLPKLVKAGRRVAVCDQLEDPKNAKGVVKRGVTDVVSPGVVLTDGVTDAGANNYLAVVFFASGTVMAAAWADVATGD
ncbi:MAG: DNA mismatch repair protein MutS, partial [Bacteroidia bacterium]|nr:DNA mismatch repair protein MutS [Bacteroidia bacterium]MDW8334891.1 DNA mismatch repair protein MutS [Bacteroidia bacterium]